jgi:hypothetical protein
LGQENVSGVFHRGVKAPALNKVAILMRTI